MNARPYRRRLVVTAAEIRERIARSGGEREDLSGEYDQQWNRRSRRQPRTKTPAPAAGR